MNHALMVHACGGSEVLQWQELPLVEPTPGEVRIKHSAVGLNFIDIYHRTGLYPGGSLPFVPGLEAAGTIESVGEGVEGFSPGDRVAYAGGPLGAYTESRNFPAERLIKLPEGISEKQAAAMMLKGMTAEYLIRRTYPVQAGETILVHAAAGGVGQLLCQWAVALGAEVIATVSSEEKADVVRALGCHHIINYRNQDVVEQVKAITTGAGVPVVYDSVGKDTFDASLSVLAPLGTLVSFGQASGKVPPFDVTQLSTMGSLYLTRPTLFDYTRTREQLLQSSRALFDMVLGGEIKLEIAQEYPLREAARAHQALESRNTRGSTLLLPD
ncbi:MAG: quinone oxidoreductase [gamma proteobacterium symbiont of Ctena orbiculata]|nr:MAG: quinone oxidoreductase [gamma proteobacterium symbiont of Ctena orbiculata]